MSLSSHRNIEVIKSQSSRGLRNKLQFIKTPYGIIEIYFDGTDHCAWITPDRPLTRRMFELLERVEKQTNDNKQAT